MKKILPYKIFVGLVIYGDLKILFVFLSLLACGVCAALSL